MTFRSLLQVASDAEKLNANMTFVQKVRRHLDELSDRILFYEICNDFCECPSRRSSIERTLEDIYDSFGNRISARARLLDGTNALISNELVYISDDREKMALTEKGKEILLEDVPSAREYLYTILDAIKQNFFHTSFTPLMTSIRKSAGMATIWRFFIPTMSGMR